MTVAIGMYQPKDERNIGSLLRTAHLYDVDFTFQIGGTPYRYHATDTSRATRSIPHTVYPTPAAFLNDQYLGGIYDAGSAPRLIAVEMDVRAIQLSRYEHPEHGIYLLGSENRGLPDDVLAWARDVVQVETKNPWSLNVATAGAIVLHHRFTTTERITAA